MNLLAIDTSTERASVALMKNGDIQSEEQGAQRDHARLILPAVERLLAQAELSLSQLDGIIYGRGPGSFTGLRIACSVAKGLAYAQDLPLYPVSSLAAIANEILKQKGTSQQTILAVLDARMNELYWACFDEQFPDAEEQVTAASEIRLDNDKPLILAGVGYEPYLSQFSPAIQKNIEQHCITYPKAEAMIRVVLTKKIQAVSAAEALPVYVRNQVTQGEPRG
ncbi:tRNA (adenosine(37)-N6)-threonylcarbamoyltransferase complex dimerization subunit type 1 TsaB [Legionella micdadei]|uniref:tRNA threonylcarbamoyladenosine biosynthesis protein TsaB n=1 Tax=Legionella micdadei TaxID=451 RepID=A0A098GED1_LEGMI|nr:tRNA (adenosine(37)-N6)-threonylcarbamoyltransferase complex dimerization subunit type 1 TsaB [Legionella micdadei]ARG98035.1 tRNA (adenosine(37)-N6)-threonylcarbamoyltransferase complex dimerization subunit type 1 TsaB [Legionella micdadei]ARH00831.1 tRNA (adenosine(37)-N6)-threonylcarbamoyltransferase complex dimerization subunit type 1 TsaB [Legionella micdadei]KTD30139.1 O-sialoglycoprotein endopeptidase [Legionella micdadei]NSL18486.1 tRNA (adenosine(37)-N6)-threonylcarbamoyltransferase